MYSSDFSEYNPPHHFLTKLNGRSNCELANDVRHFRQSTFSGGAGNFHLGTVAHGSGEWRPGAKPRQGVWGQFVDIFCRFCPQTRSKIETMGLTDIPILDGLFHAGGWATSCAATDRSYMIDAV